MAKLRKLFSTPKRAALTIACGVVMVATVGVCIAVYAANRTGGPPQAAAIGGENAQKFAFADAGVDPVEATAVSARYGRWEDRFVYEVGFIAGGTEYDYTIDASDGAVLQKEARTVKGPEESAPQGGLLPLEEAREIALKDAGLDREEVSFTQAELDGDGEPPVYEFAFYGGNVEYGYGINARTGAVYSKSTTTYVGQGTGTASPPPAPSRTAESTPPAADSPAPSQGQARPSASLPPQTPAVVAPPSANMAPPTAGIAPPGGLSGAGQSQITLDEAKGIAVGDAGLTEAQVAYHKAKLDYEHGVAVYEIEFISGGMEYEYEIDAATGAVLEASREQHH